MVAELEKVVLPYTLSVPTQIAGTVALDFRREMEERVASLVEERGPAVRGARRHRRAVTVVPSGANFLLVRVDGDAHELWQRLLERGVLVRDFSSLAARRGLPARHRRHARRRTTRSSPRSRAVLPEVVA